jgi:hypothetical protein
VVDEELLTDRINIEEEANKKISKLSSEIATLIFGKESEFFYIVPNFYLGAFEGLSRNGQSATGIIVKRHSTWWRGTNSFIGALETILPDLIPLKTFREMNVDSVKEIFENHVFEQTFQRLLKLGNWIHVKQDVNVRCIQTQDDAAQPCTKNYTPSYQDYVSKVSSSDEGTRVLDTLYSKLFADASLRSKINSSLKSIYGFSIDNLAGALDFLRGVVQNGVIHIYPSNEIRKIFQKNVRNKEADNLFEHLIFKKGKSLRTSPMVPVVRGQLLVLPWILNLESVFDEILKTAMNQTNLAGEIGNFMGKVAFENYVAEKVQGIGFTPQRNIRIKVSKYPGIARALGKNTEFELDLLVPANGKGYVISCKGGKKELPRLSYDQQWAEYPENDIKIRIEENKEYLDEVSNRAECFRSDTNLAKDYGVYGLEIIPVVVYASIQPLSIDGIRQEEGVNCDAIIRTTDELCEMLSKPDFG